MPKRMHRLSAKAVRTIEQMHSAWIDEELAGNTQRLLEFCVPGIKFHPPDTAVIRGRDAVLAYLRAASVRIHRIEIAGRQLGGSGNHASLTALYNTTFSLRGDPHLKQATGTHTWQLRQQAGRWLIVSVSWS